MARRLEQSTVQAARWMLKQVQHDELGLGELISEQIAGSATRR